MKVSSNDDIMEPTVLFNGIKPGCLTQCKLQFNPGTGTWSDYIETSNRSGISVEDTGRVKYNVDTFAYLIADEQLRLNCNGGSNISTSFQAARAPYTLKTTGLACNNNFHIGNMSLEDCAAATIARTTTTDDCG